MLIQIAILESHAGDIIPPSADTEAACGVHVLKSNKTTEETATCLHPAGVVTFKRLQKVQPFFHIHCSLQAETHVILHAGLKLSQETGDNTAAGLHTTGTCRTCGSSCEFCSCVSTPHERDEDVLRCVSTRHHIVFLLCIGMT